MVRLIQAKTLLSPVNPPDPWFGMRYIMNLYRGCQHQCIYCDSRSECYQIDDFSDIQVKANALTLLDKELKSKREKGTIGTGSMNDPYMPLEAEQQLTRGALECIARRGFPVHVITKGTLVVRDVDLLQTISQTYAAVSISITTPNDGLCRQIEPGAPVASRRFEALETLSRGGILTGVTLMPVLPFLADQERSVVSIVERAADAGARYILPAFGVTLRDRQREWFYARLDVHFPGLRQTYERQFGERYSCASPRAARLEEAVGEACARRGIPTRMPFYQAPPEAQLKLF